MSTASTAAAAAAAGTAQSVAASAIAASAGDDSDADEDAASLNSAELLEGAGDDDDEDAFDEDQIEDEMPLRRSAHTRMINQIKIGPKKKKPAPHTMEAAKAKLMDHLQDLSSRNCPKLCPGKPKQCRCLEILNNNDAFKEA
eukprot:scaffold178972_cov30-Cyclotella_meneghiniana.AAC.1